MLLERTKAQNESLAKDVEHFKSVLEEEKAQNRIMIKRVEASEEEIESLKLRLVLSNTICAEQLEKIKELETSLSNKDASIEKLKQDKESIKSNYSSLVKLAHLEKENTKSVDRSEVKLKITQLESKVALIKEHYERQLIERNERIEELSREVKLCKHKLKLYEDMEQFAETNKALNSAMQQYPTESSPKESGDEEF
eukprot:TRINITY_DN1969_c0_g1_i7.p1 TRINITY_DN1969_c0_g1~~TRINITY_DN1969_c0_g1_i7.p1  ORF type:complete len:197 (+),score=43.38 TRINITY_DN1969_c0_g1_i7:360-950(+)